ncbi:Nn.00g043550.m01.CDS01 [Neocucurbitaria sp. VM-36]
MAQTYLFYNNYSGSYLSIDYAISNQSLHALPLNADANPLHFIFTAFYTTDIIKICTLDPATYCLDSGSRDSPRLAKSDGSNGQLWRLIQVRDAFKLSNEYMGNGWFLDVERRSKRAGLTAGDAAGQYWAIVDVGCLQTNSSSYPKVNRDDQADTGRTVTTPGVTTPTTAESSLPSTSFQPTPTEAPITSPLPSSSAWGLSTGAKAGIGAGCAVLAIGIAALIFGMLFWRKKAKQNVQHRMRTDLMASNRELQAFEQNTKYSELDAAPESCSPNPVSPTQSPTAHEDPTIKELPSLVWNDGPRNVSVIGRPNVREASNKDGADESSRCNSRDQ